MALGLDANNQAKLKLMDEGLSEEQADIRCEEMFGEGPALKREILAQLVRSASGAISDEERPAFEAKLAELKARTEKFVAGDDLPTH